MQPNPVLKRLGFEDDARVVIFHADDIGMCQAAMDAYVELIDFGILKSAAIMVPCPWFLAAAEYCRQHPDADVGVHITLTSEWQHYRWGPVSTRDTASGMIDPEGYFYRTSIEAQDHGDPAYMEIEIQAQIERAIEAGINPTHIDTHMGSAMHPNILPIYVRAGLSRRLPPLIFWWDEDRLRERGLADQMARLVQDTRAMMEENDIPVIDHIYALPLDEHENRLDLVKRTLSELEPGTITHYLLHPSKDTPELRAIAPDWRARVADYEVFLSAELDEFVKQSGIQSIGYRALRDVLRR